MSLSEKPALSQCRLDLWLWAARFYKTRNLAALNIKKGLVRLSGKSKTKPGSLINLDSQLVIDQNFVRKTVLVEEIAVKRVSSAKAKSFYKIIFEDSQEGAKFFQARTRYKPDKKMRRNLKALKEKLKLFVDTEIINEYKKENNLNISQVNSISSNVAQKITNHFAHSLKDKSIAPEKSLELINKIFQL